MKTILVAVTTANGYIANPVGSYPWASSEDRQEFEKLYREAGCIVIGRYTYDTLKNRANFPTSGRQVVVVTRNPKLVINKPNIAVVQSPQAALEYLESHNFKQALIGGGGILNTSFMELGLIDEIILTVEPMVISSGVPVFAPGSFDSQLRLLETRHLTNQTIQLSYRIVKPSPRGSFA